MTQTSFTLCVYCGSADAVDPAYLLLAEDFGRELAQKSYRLVYGGGRVGLMGRLANGALAAGGSVTGILPHFLEEAEIGHHGLSELILVKSMHQRKTMMAERADAFVILPGGYGTLDEFFEIVTWRQLGLHDKPIVLFDYQDYWSPLETLLRHMREAGFARPRTEHLWRPVKTSEQLFLYLETALKPQSFKNHSSKSPLF